MSRLELSEAAVNDTAAITLAGDLLRETREEVGRADGKASTILAAVLVVSALVVASVLAGQWDPFRLKFWAELTWWVASAGIVTAIVFLCACIYPNVSNQVTKEMLSYFGHVILHETRDQLTDALRKHAETPLVRLSDQLFVISRIVRRKYWFMRTGMWCLAAAAILAGMTVLLQRWS